MKVEEIAGRAGNSPFLFLLGFIVLALSTLAAVLVTAKWSWPRAPARLRAMPTHHAGLGIGIAVATLLFIVMAVAVFAGDTMTRVDVAVAGALHQHASPTIIGFFKLLTYLGSEGVIAAGFLFSIGCVVKKKWRALIGWTIALTGGAIFNALLKSLFTRPRPTFSDPIATSTGFSFPSGHSMSSWIAAGMLLYFLASVIRDDRRRLAVIAIALVGCVMIGFSRLILGVHYLSDVIGGFAAGTLWLGLCIAALELTRQRPPPELSEDNPQPPGGGPPPPPNAPPPAS